MGFRLVHSKAISGYFINTGLAQQEACGLAGCAGPIHESYKIFQPNPIGKSKQVLIVMDASTLHHDIDEGKIECIRSICSSQ